MNHSRRILAATAALAAATSMSGCALFGIGPGGSTADPVATAALAVQTRDDFNALASVDSTLPTSGEANYSGFMAGVVKDTQFTGGNPTQIGRMLVGDANFEVAFMASDVDFSGTVSNILAKDETDQNEFYIALTSGTAADVQALLETYDGTSGELTFTNGRLDTPVGTTKNITSNVSGTVTHNGDAIEFGGTTRGYFIGANGEGMFVNAETHEGLTIKENGGDRFGDFGIRLVETN